MGEHASSPNSSGSSAGAFKMNDGDWLCGDAACGNVNFARRTTCNRCSKERLEPNSSKKKLGTEIGKSAADKSRGLFSADDWQCSKCANVNWARRQTCNVCNAPKFGEVEARTGYGGGYNERGRVEYRPRHNSDDDDYDEFGRRKKRKIRHPPSPPKVRGRGELRHRGSSEEYEYRRSAYTLRERVTAAAWAVVHNNCLFSAELFKKHFGKPAPHAKTIFSWHQKLLKSGCLVDSHRAEMMNFHRPQFRCHCQHESRERGHQQNSLQKGEIIKPVEQHTLGNDQSSLYIPTYPSSRRDRLKPSASADHRFNAAEVPLLDSICDRSSTDRNAYKVTSDSLDRLPILVDSSRNVLNGASSVTDDATKHSALSFRFERNPCTYLGGGVHNSGDRVASTLTKMFSNYSEPLNIPLLEKECQMTPKIPFINGSSADRVYGTPAPPVDFSEDIMQPDLSYGRCEGVINESAVATHPRKEGVPRECEIPPEYIPTKINPSAAQRNQRLFAEMPERADAHPVLAASPFCQYSPDEDALYGSTPISDLALPAVQLDTFSPNKTQEAEVESQESVHNKSNVTSLNNFNFASVNAADLVLALQNIQNNSMGQVSTPLKNKSPANSPESSLVANSIPFFGDMFDPGSPSAVVAATLSEEAPVAGFKSFSLPKPKNLNRLCSLARRKPGGNREIVETIEKRTKKRAETSEEESGEEGDLSKYDLWGSDEEAPKDSTAAAPAAPELKRSSDSGSSWHRSRSASPGSGSGSGSSSSSSTSRPPPNRYDDFNLNNDNPRDSRPVAPRAVPLRSARSRSRDRSRVRHRRRRV